jgi:alpha-N-acetylglucosaminidase
MIGRVVLLCLLCTLCYANSIDVVKGLIARTLPNHQDLFQLSTLNTTTDTFEIETVQASTKRGYQIKLSGNNGVSIASALHHYLKYFCSCQISWEAVQLNIPEPAPKVSKISLATPHDYRYYMNTCTHG